MTTMRSAITLFVAYLLLILQSTVLELAPVHMVTPSLGLLVVLHVGLSSKWTISSAAVVSFATGYLFDLVSGAPQGVHAFVFVLMALFARGLSTRRRGPGDRAGGGDRVRRQPARLGADRHRARAGRAGRRLRRPAPGAASRRS